MCACLLIETVSLRCYSLKPFASWLPPRGFACKPRLTAPDVRLPNRDYKLLPQVRGPRSERRFFASSRPCKSPVSKPLHPCRRKHTIPAFSPEKMLAANESAIGTPLAKVRSKRREIRPKLDRQRIDSRKRCCWRMSTYSSFWIRLELLVGARQMTATLVDRLIFASILAYLAYIIIEAHGRLAYMF